MSKQSKKFRILLSLVGYDKVKNLNIVELRDPTKILENGEE